MACLIAARFTRVDNLCILRHYPCGLRCCTRLEINNAFLGLLKLCKSLPSKVVDAPSLEVFKARLDGALGSKTLWVASLPEAVGLGF